MHGSTIWKEPEVSALESFVARHPWWSVIIFFVALTPVSMLSADVATGLAIASWVVVPLWRMSILKRRPELRKAPPAPQPQPQAGPSVQPEPQRTSPAATGYVRVQYRHPSDRRPVARGTRTYTFRWPHHERPVPGTWIELPSDYGNETGVIVEEGQRSDFTGQIKPVGRIITDMPRVPTEASSHNAPAVTAPKPVEPWGSCDTSRELEFEHLHRREIGVVLRRNQASTNTNVGLDAVLVQSLGPCPAVLLDGHWVGNVVDQVTFELREALRNLGEAGQGLKVPARLWSTDDDGVLRSRVSIRLPQTSEIDPPGPLPAGAHLVLPAGSKVQVTGEEHYLDELVALLEGEQEVPVVAELYRLEKMSARSTKTVVGVRIYGDEVGNLTPTMSAHFLPLIEACEEEGVAVCCRAVVKGNQLKADVVLDAQKAGSLSDDWIEEHLYKPLSGDLKSVPAPQAASDDMWADEEEYRSRGKALRDELDGLGEEPQESGEA